MLTINGIIRLQRQIQDAGIPIVGINSAGNVSPEDLQKSAQPIIDAFDDSPAAEEKYQAQRKYDEAKKSLALTADQNAVIVRAVLDVLAKEIQVAQPAYVVPSTDALSQKVQAVIDAKKPTADAAVDVVP